VEGGRYSSEPLMASVVKARSTDTHSGSCGGKLAILNHRKDCILIIHQKQVLIKARRGTREGLPYMCTSRTWRHSSSVVSTKGFPRNTPALLTRMSTWPKCRTQSSKRACTCGGPSDTAH
jgi:hypothetical protein